MIDNFVVTQTNNFLTLTRPEGRGGTFRLGEVLTADVLDVIESGMVTLRITPPVGRGLEGGGLEGGRPEGGGPEGGGLETRGSMLIRARTSVAMDKGDRVLLEVMGADKDVRLKFLGVSMGRDAEAAAPQRAAVSMEQKIQTLLGELSGSKLSGAQFKDLQEVFAKFPQGLKNAFPEFKALEAALPEIEKLNAGIFKDAVEDTGVLFETRLKFAAAQKTAEADAAVSSENPGDEVLAGESADILLPKTAMKSSDIDIPKTAEESADIDMPKTAEEAADIDRSKTAEESADINASKTDVDAGEGFSPSKNLLKKGREHDISHRQRDLKAVLLRTREILKNDKVLENLKHSGMDPREINTAVEKLVKNIEFFQLTSHANDVLYTFLPFSWNQLKDGELVFKKNKYYGNKSYTCDMNLDLEQLGKISISTTVYEGEFFVSFNAEKEDTRNLIEANKSLLNAKFKAVGLALKAVNVSRKKEVDFNTVVKEKEGLHLTI